jgi:HK97 family phage major capsid protein
MLKEKELTEELERELKSARAIASQAETEGREDFTADEAANLKKSLDRAKEIRKELEPFKESASLKSLLGEFGPANASTEPVTADAVVAGAKGTLGTQFANSAAFKSWLKEIAPNGFIPKERKGIQSPPLKFEGLKALDRNRAKALITAGSETSAGALIEAMFLGLQDGMGRFQRPLTIRDIITVMQTDTDSVEFVRVTSTTNNAAPVDEATSADAPTQDGSTGALILNAGGGYKPESAMALEKVATPVKTIAHWIPITKKALSSPAQIRGLIDEFLDYGLNEELEDQIVNGDGNDENFDGLAVTSNIQTHAKSTDSIIAAARKAKRKVQTVGRATPTAYLMHPEDWERFDLLTDNEQRYHFGGPLRPGTPMLWGLPVVESEAVTIGQPYVGNFRTCVLWDREQASISVSDSHADFFIRNLVALLAELSAAFGVFRPQALVRMTGMNA